MAKVAAKKPPTKTEIYASIAETTGLAKKDVGAVFDALNDEITKALEQEGPRDLHDSRPVQDRCSEEARHPSPRRHQSVHRREDDVQGQTSPQHHQDSSR